MRKRILCVGLIALAVLMMTACQPRYIFWPIPDMDKSTPYDVASPEEFTAMLATSGQARLTDDIELADTYFMDLPAHCVCVHVFLDICLYVFVVLHSG